MTDESKTGEDITINVKGPSELKVQITISPLKSVLDLKEAIAAKSDVEKDRQRLIYSGKVLKDEETISTYKIQTGHTIHMVKGAAKSAAPGGSASAGASAGASASAAPRLPQMGTGLNVAGNPVDNVENIHHGLAGFNPFAGMQGINNLNDPNAMAGMMQNPEFLRSMADMMSRPEVVDQMILANPQLAGMAPQLRQMMNNPMVRQMMSNPETLRMIMQMQAMDPQGMGGMGGMGGFGGMGGMFGQQPQGGAGAGAGGTGGQQAPTDPFPNLFAPQAAPSGTGGGAGTGAGTGTGATPGSPPAAGVPPNPFAALFGPGGMGMGGFGAGTGAGAGAGAGTEGAAGQGQARNPFAFDPSLLFGQGGMGGMGGMGWPPSPAAPRDTRPPEEIYATQLGQLNAMGLWDAQKNITALRRTGGNVEAAIELIFSGQLG